MNETLAAEALAGAWRGGPALEALPEGAIPATVAEGFAIQAALARLIGRPTVGWKLAVSTPAAQKANGLTAPTVGELLEGMLLATGATFAAGALRQPEIEPEIALVLARDLPGRCDAAAVRAATGEVRLAMEIADTRYRLKPVHGQPGIVADMNACGAVLLGPAVEYEAAAAAPIRVTLGDGRVVEGFSPAARPDPFETVAFLAGFLAERGRALRAGDAITTGTCAPPTRTPPGRAVCAFGGLGEVVATIG